MSTGREALLIVSIYTHMRISAYQEDAIGNCMGHTLLLISQPALRVDLISQIQ